MCEYTPFTGKWALEVHHIDEDRTNNEPDNLMTLCSNCHREMHGLLHEYGDSDVAMSVLAKFIKRLLS